MSKVKTTISINTTIITLVLIVLKLAGVLDWSWFWILSPTLIPFIIFGIIFGSVILCAGLYTLLDWFSVRRR